MTTIKVRGFPQEAEAAEALRLGRFADLFTVEADPGDAVRIAGAREEGAAEIVIENVEDDDILELELPGGIRLWSTCGQLKKDGEGRKRGDGDYSGLLQQRGGDSESWRLVPDALPVDLTRGAGIPRILSIRRLKVGLAEGAAKWTGRQVVERIESQLVQGPGLHRCNDAGVFGLDGFDASELPGSRVPILLMIHGTASSTEGSFGELWLEPRGAEWRVCMQRYAGHVYAFEHRTLSESPIANALDLATALPEGSRLHLVTHSRGGLVGELLCRGQAHRGNGPGEPFTAEELGAFDTPDREADREALERLNEVLKAKHLQVERFVRVACPARGTTLASGRLDRYLTVLLNVIGQIPFLKATMVYEAFSAFLLAMVKLRTDPREIPGLEAQMPTSPLIAVLNGSPVELDADLSVIAGDFEGAGFFGRLKELATNLYYWSRHDLVVNTEAMYGGGRRMRGRGWFVFDDGDDVNHFRYFGNERTFRRLVARLERSDGEQAGFRPFRALEDIPTGVRAARGHDDRPIVFLLPGILGSHLKAGGDRIWLDIPDLFFGGFRKLDIDRSDVRPDGLLGSAYTELVTHLRQSHEVIRFPFDWRRSVLDEGRRLAQAIDGRLQASGVRPVRIVAHSMGGLVAMAMMALRPEVWEGIRSREGGRLLMLGTPCRGSFAIARILLGQEKTLKMIDLLDMKHDLRELLEIVVKFPGILEMLPDWGPLPMFAAESWSKVRPAREHWPLPDEAALEQAWKAREQIAVPTLSDPQHVFYIAGQADETPVAIERGEAGGAAFRVTREGDGRVPWAQGIPQGVPVWYSELAHGDLAGRAERMFPETGDDPYPDEHLEAIREILEEGETLRLPRTPPVTRGAGQAADGEGVLREEDRIQIYPDEADLTAAALGRRPPVAVPARRRIRIGVAHGNLAFSNNPVLVGHYEGDTIISAEAHLDRILQGRLRELYDLGLYPGPVETCRILLNTGRTPPGAIVAGLGAVGSLTPGGLKRSFTRAVLEYAVAHAECSPQGPPPRLTSLLVGTSAGGLSVRDAMASIINGVLEANEALGRMAQAPDRPGPMPVEALEFLELYEDLAIEATRTLACLGDEPRLRDEVFVETELHAGQRGERRASYGEPPDWWRRMEITMRPDGALKFTLLTDRARAEIRLHATQRVLVDGFIEKAIRSSRDDGEVSSTLFELLVPNELKEYAPDRSPLVLVVDEDAARYPWELLRYRFDGQEEPLALKSGVLRQLALREFRKRVEHSTGGKALVVGDPALPADSGFSQLPGARREARQAAARLGQRFDVMQSIGQGAEEIVRALFRHPYQVIHLAGHGVYEFPSAGDGATTTVTGMVIGAGVFITPVEIEQMSRVPEMVFINCCHLGRIEQQKEDWRPRWNRLAANLSTQLIGMGVKVVIAAGWAVDDGAAATFASAFYERMLAGESLGDAVLKARLTAHREHPGVNTWGAYQCYGDPDYRLIRGEGRRAVTKGRLRFVCPAEVVARLESLASRAATATPAEQEELKAELGGITKELPGRWLERGDVLGAMGRVHGELLQLSESIECYRRALRAEQAGIGVWHIEQMANMKVRLARKLHHEGNNGEAREILGEAIRDLKGMVGQFGDTIERLSLLGSAYKCRARLTRRGNARNNWLGRMTGQYREAHELSLKRYGRVEPYPLLNQLIGAIVLGRVADAQRQDRETLKHFDTLIGQAEDATTGTSFWDSAMHVECRLLRALRDGTLKDEGTRREIAAGYVEAFSRGSIREICSVHDQLQFLVEVLEPDGKTKDIVAALGRLLEELAGSFGDCAVFQGSPE